MLLKFPGAFAPGGRGENLSYNVFSLGTKSRLGYGQHSHLRPRAGWRSGRMNIPLSIAAYAAFSRPLTLPLIMHALIHTCLDLLI